MANSIKNTQITLFREIQSSLAKFEGGAERELLYESGAGSDFNNGVNISMARARNMTGGNSNLVCLSQSRVSLTIS
jgi:hypothetical protein